MKKQVILFSASSFVTLGALLMLFPGEDTVPHVPRTVVIPSAKVDLETSGDLEGVLGRIQDGASTLYAKTDDLRAAGASAADKINGQVAGGIAAELARDGDLSPGDLKEIGVGVVAALPGAVDEVANALPLAKGEGLSGLRAAVTEEAAGLKSDAIAAAAEAARAAGKAVTPSIAEAVKDGRISLEDASSVAGSVATEVPKSTGGVSGILSKLFGKEG